MKRSLYGADADADADADAALFCLNCKKIIV
jgi:hypothetical protein